VFLPLTNVFKQAPDATVAIYPSDHFVYPEPTFNRAVAEAVALADQHEDRVVLLGVSPSGPETEYGWIVPGRPLPGTSDDRARAVSRFIEKPAKNAAESAFRNGALWNTSILVGKVQSFWRLGWRRLPQMMVPFVELWDSLGTENESAVLERIYRTLPTLDFSRDLLQAATANLVVSKLSNVLWSDWGSPARIRETLELIGVRPQWCMSAGRAGHQGESLTANGT
jgi:mannose-1-phosphate guanylyltransferase